MFMLRCSRVVGPTRSVAFRASALASAQAGLTAACCVALASGKAAGQLTDPFPAEFELSSLLASNGGDGTLGFVLRGIDVGDYAGTSIASAGDVNGDGVDDLLIGAPLADPGGRPNAGETYVVFGRRMGSAPAFPASFDLSALDGSNGFVVNGVDIAGFSGESIAAAGDVNGDGAGDLIVSASAADIPGAFDAGRTYVIFGRRAGIDPPFMSTFELASLLPENDADGTRGFVVNGFEAATRSGTAVSSAGDINSDGVDDVLIGVPGASPNGVDRAGACYVVFGRRPGIDAPFPATLDLSSIDGSNGFRLNGVDERDGFGTAVASAGDVNGDGVDDIVLGAWESSPLGRGFAGRSFVVFGRRPGVDAAFPASLDLASLDGTFGFAVNGADWEDQSGISVAAAGDVNADGVGDVLIGAPSTGVGPSARTGEAFVVYGRRAGIDPPFTPAVDLALLDGENGARLAGVQARSRTGQSVSSAGDLNGDGIDDIVVGSPWSDLSERGGEGRTHVVFGRPLLGSVPPFTNPVQLSTLNGLSGFTINGIKQFDSSGNDVVRAGDINGDGVDDLAIGARTSFATEPGECYVVFGRRVAAVCPADFNLDTVAGDIFDLFDFLAALDEGLDFNGDTVPADIFDLFDFLLILDTPCP